MIFLLKQTLLRNFYNTFLTLEFKLFKLHYDIKQFKAQFQLIL